MRMNGPALRAIRERVGLLQTALADIADVDRSYISGIENGHRNTASRATAERLADALKVNIAEITVSEAAAEVTA